MFEILGVVHDVESVAALLGVPVGLLIGCVAIAIFVPFVRNIAIAGAVIAGTELFCLGYGDHHGAARVTADRDAADARLAAAAAQRDVSIETKLEQDFPALPAADGVSNDDKTTIAAISGAASGACQLGADALRVRGSPKETGGTTAARGQAAGGVRARTGAPAVARGAVARSSAQPPPPRGRALRGRARART